LYLKFGYNFAGYKLAYKQAILKRMPDGLMHLSKNYPV
jgi:hypothetical protein